MAALLFQDQSSGAGVESGGPRASPPHCLREGGQLHRGDGVVGGGMGCKKARRGKEMTGGPDPQLEVAENAN